MRLTSLACNHTKVSDLAPLAAMPLTSLDCDGTLVTQLAPLEGMKLTDLHVRARRCRTCCL